MAAAGPLLRGVVWQVLSRYGRADDSADVLQEVFVRLVRDDFNLLKRHDPTRASLSTWLGVVATSTALDWLRKSPPAHAPLDEVAEPAAAEIEGAEAAHDALAGLPPGLLPPRQALILKMIYTDDMDVADVAQQLHIEAQTVRSLRHKALNTLRDFLRARRTPRG